MADFPLVPLLPGLLFTVLGIYYIRKGCGIQSHVPAQSGLAAAYKRNGLATLTTGAGLLFVGLVLAFAIHSLH